MRSAGEILDAHRIPRIGQRSSYVVTCPRCSHLRRKKTDRCLSVLIDGRGVRWRCHHCAWEGGEFFDGPPQGRNPTNVIANPPSSSCDDARERIARARAIWSQGLDPHRTMVEAYLLSRKLRLLDSIRYRVVRFHPACPWMDEEAGELVLHPAMLTAMRDIHTDELKAVQVTALRRHSAAKIGRRMRGVAKGAAIKLVADDMVTEAVGITEGFEDAVSLMLQGWGPVWALGSADAIKDFPLLPGIWALTIFCDDDDNETGLKAARHCAARWRAANREVRIEVPS